MEFPIEQLEQTPKTIGLGISCLRDLAENNFNRENSFRVAVPDELLRLASANTDESRPFLMMLLREFCDVNDERGYSLAGRLQEALTSSEAEARFEVITDDPDPNIEKDLEGFFGDSKFEISLSAKDNFIRRYYAKLISWSKKTGQVIVERTEKAFTELTRFIVSLQIPKHVAAAFKWKEEMARKLFGGRILKFFVGIALAIALRHHHQETLANAHVVFAFFDP